MLRWLSRSAHDTTMTRGQTVSVNTKKKYMPAAVSETGLEGGGAPGAAAVRRARGGAPGVGDPREQERDGAGGEDRGGTEANDNKARSC